MSDLQKRSIRSLVSICPDAVNCSDHCRGYDKRNVNYTTMLPLTLLDPNVDIEREKEHTRVKINRSEDGCLILVSFDKDTYCFASLLGYLIWFTFYCITKEFEDTYNSIYSIMHNRKECIAKKRPVICIPAVLTSSHIRQIRTAMKVYGLCDATFVNQNIVMGIAYGFFNNKSVENDYNEYMLICDCGAATVSICLIQFQKNIMNMLYSSSISGFGGRQFRIAMLKSIIENDARKQSVYEDSVQYMKVYESTKKAITSICNEGIDEIDVEIQNLFGNDDEKDDIFTTVTRSTFQKYYDKLGTITTFKNLLQPVVKYVKDHNIPLKCILPVGGCMRIPELQEILLLSFQDHLSSKGLSFTCNMDEDLGSGACRLSHLLYEKRIVFDEKLKNTAVWLSDCYMENQTNESMSNVFTIKCSDEYIDSIREHSLEGLKDKEAELDRIDTRVIEDSKRLLNHINECEKEKNRALKRRQEVEERYRYCLREIEKRRNKLTSDQLTAIANAKNSIENELYSTTVFSSDDGKERMLQKLKVLYNVIELEMDDKYVEDIRPISVNLGTEAIESGDDNEDDLPKGIEANKSQSGSNQSNLSIRKSMSNTSLLNKTQSIADDEGESVNEDQAIMDEKRSIFRKSFKGNQSKSIIGIRTTYKMNTQPDIILEKEGEELNESYETDPSFNEKTSIPLGKDSERRKTPLASNRNLLKENSKPGVTSIPSLSRLKSNSRIRNEPKPMSFLSKKNSKPNREDLSARHPDEKSEDGAEKLEDEIEKPEDEIEKPEDGAEKPEDGAEKPEDEIEKPEDEIEKPEDGEEKPEDEIEKPEDEIEKPEDRAEKPEDGEEKPEDGEEKPEDRTEKPEDETEKLEDGEEKPEDETEKLEDGVEKLEDGVKKPEDETEKLEDETKKHEDEPDESDATPNEELSKPSKQCCVVL